MLGAIRLRPDQKEDIPRVHEALRRTRRVLLQRATGTGKTVLFCAISAVVTEGGADTLILQYREELIGQTSRTVAEMAVEHCIVDAQHPSRAAPGQIASIDTIARSLDSYQPGDFRLVFTALHDGKLDPTTNIAPANVGQSDEHRARQAGRRNPRPCRQFTTSRSRS